MLPHPDDGLDRVLDALGLSGRGVTSVVVRLARDAAPEVIAHVHRPLTGGEAAALAGLLGLLGARVVVRPDPHD